MEAEGGEPMSGIIRYHVTFPNRPNHFIDYVGFGGAEVKEKVSKLYPNGEYSIEQVV